MKETIFGIDLGTTNSCLALVEPGGPRVIDIDGQPIVPSVVSLDRKTGAMIVGSRARNRLALEPGWTVRSIKRRMGLNEPVRIGDRTLLPEEISAEILRYLREQGGEACGREVRRAVITVPAYFGDAQRRATLRAGELAGLDVVRLLNEPTAAALVYDRTWVRGHGAGAALSDIAGAALSDVAGSGPGAPQRVLVYDLGGGTFDVSVVEIGGEINEVRASCGNNHLGGDDFDLLLAEHILAEVRERYGRDLGDDPRARARLLDAAERAKIDLSTHPYARVTEEALAPGLHLDLEIERTAFEELIQRDLDGTLAEVDRALAEARLRPGQIDRVVLVGGSTRIPKVLQMLENRFECPVEHAIDPALGVGLGAALQGAILGGEIFDQILVDVAAHSLGVRTLGGAFPMSMGEHFSAVIRRNTQIPATRSEVYFTIHDNQEKVQVAVYQGESVRCSENTFIGHFFFELAPMPADSPVLVEFSYDLDGIIRVVVSQKGTDRRKEVTLSTRRGGPDAADTAAPVGARPVDNYILRKARALAASLPAGDMQERLRTAAVAYEAELGRGEGSPDLEQAENELLELLEALEEAPLSSEP